MEAADGTKNVIVSQYEFRAAARISLVPPTVRATERHA